MDRLFAKIKKIYRHPVVLSLAIVMAALSGACSSSAKETEAAGYQSYLGNEVYDSDVYAMCVEKIEDEEEPGVIYREVTDLEILKTSDIPVMIYFFTSASTDRAGITAGVEDIAQRLDGRVLVVGINVMTHRDVAQEYEAAYVPEFVLLKKGEVTDKFDAFERDYWTAMDVYNWLVLNEV
jgi:thiol-disulfide isomerase/thioredoxin